ncbi:hypothetical protein TSPI_00204 [Trichinella spiralis]|uniref:Uncharacterized protein n=1 Tax=Trichinella spiralis TaxID=6334 RepID=A0ABR3KX84_TRISP
MLRKSVSTYKRFTHSWKTERSNRKWAIDLHNHCAMNDVQFNSTVYHDDMLSKMHRIFCSSPTLALRCHILKERQP